jgi:four helix bundle protein
MYKNNNQLIQRTKKFSHSCVKLVLSLNPGIIENQIKNQLVRCSTSVAANYRAACLAQSKKSFIAKLSIVIEEVDECNFWLEFIKDEDIEIIEDELLTLIAESKELTSIFISSRKTAKINMVEESEIKYYSILNNH